MNSSNKIITCLIALIFLLLTTGLQAAVEMKKITEPGSLPGDLATLARSGDFLINDGQFLYLLGVEARDFPTVNYYPLPDGRGALLALVPADSPSGNAIVAGQLQVRTGFDYYYPAYSKVRITQSRTKVAPLVIELKGDFVGRKGEKGDLKTIYTIPPAKGQVTIKTTFRNSGQLPIDKLALSVYFNALHSYYFNPYHQKYFPGFNFRVYQKKSLYLGWVNLGSQPVELPEKLLPGQTVEFNYVLLVRKEAAGLLTDIYSLLKKEALPVEISLENNQSGPAEIVVEEVVSSSVFFRGYHQGNGLLKILLPEGNYRLRGHLFPAVVEKTIKVSRSEDRKFELVRPAVGHLKLNLLDRKGKPLPGKISVFGLEGTRTPYFAPENPVQSGRSWERFKNSVYTHPQPLEIELAAGRYLISASYGPLYTNDRQVMEVLAGQKQEITFRLEKVVNLKGYISLDPHLHTINSDGTLSVAERLKSIVAENLDAAIATDHNFVTDYQPELVRLGLADYLRIFSGVEVTPLNSYLHFNNYPVAIKPEEKTRGAITPAFERVEDLFQACQKKNPTSLLQLNHPRAGNLGYFENIGLDREKADFVVGDLALTFDLIEVMNGASFHRGNDQAVADWLNLLAKGYFFPAVGSSDSHGAAGGEPGYSRLFVRLPKKLAEFTWEELASALKKGQSFVSNGPLVEFTVNGKYQPGDTVTDRDGKVRARIRVQSTPWIDINEVRVIVNGERKITFPVSTPAIKPLKFDKKLDIELSADSYLVVEVSGQKSLYPVVQQPARTGQPEEAALPYALTNPVFIDFDGNGQFDAPRPKKIETREAASEQK
ncbi:MAG: CehA/McbA family metallohydrolase [Candidatus Saccharicenans sp.]|uniref:CehA/McbA family metallohydrolase n=1 Tax=Candidatus Saccharicenans sp. TaxID=2819258 RepID=UPI00404A2DFD